MGSAEKKQNYDQSFSQVIVYGDVQRKITTLDKDIFEGSKMSHNLTSDGLVQTIDPGVNQVLAKFDDGKSAIVLAHSGKGSLYYLAAPLKSADYHLLLLPLTQKLGIKRPVTAVGLNGNLITGAEVRAVERETDYLVYACNLTSGTIEFDLKASKTLGSVIDLRSLTKTGNNHIKLEPFQETIYKIDKNK